VYKKPVLEKNNPDILVLENHTIETIRSLPIFFATRPIKQKTKLCIIPDAHLLQAPAQNALLKILEEPGENNFVELYTNYPQRLLPTIRSRCQIIYQSVETVYIPSLHKLPTNTAQALALSETLSSDKEAVVPWLESQIYEQQQILIKAPTYETATLLKKLIKTQNMANNNVDPKTCLDWLFLS